MKSLFDYISILLLHSIIEVQNEMFFGMVYLDQCGPRAICSRISLWEKINKKKK